MNKKKISLLTIVIYLSIIGMGVFIGNYITENYLQQLTIFLISQIIATLYVIYILDRYYNWKNVGLDKLNMKNFIWFVPYVIIIVSMIYTFISSVFKVYMGFSVYMWVDLVITFIGSFAVGFSEELIFRGIILNSFKSKKSIVKAMLLGSIGFSIMHIVNVFTGSSILEVLHKVILASFLGFAFIALAIKLNNIWPMIIFHSIWNFILMASDKIGINVCEISIFLNLVNIIVGTILWILIIREFKNKSKKYLFIK